MQPVLPPPARLQSLLSAEPVVYSFDPNQTGAERRALMAQVPPDAQDAARTIMLYYILAWCLDDGEDGPYAGERAAGRPLLYYMAAWDEMDEILENEDEEIRGHSSDWRLAVYDAPGATFYDFNGWPGDNEAGAGLYRSAGARETVLVFTNSDRSLAAARPEHAEVVAWFEARRRERAEADFDESGGEPPGAASQS
jgi:hypothetical protein